MNNINYYNFIQPSLIQFSKEEYEEIPESLRGKFALNLNILGIRWFLENFLLIEDTDNPGKFMYMLTNDNEKIALDFLSIQGKLDIPRAYIVLTESFIKSQVDFKDWVLKALTDTSIYVTGTSNFKLGRDYYLNDTVYTYLSEYEENSFSGGEINYKLPNYLNEDFELTKWFVLLDDDIYSWNNLEYFYNKNVITDYEYDEDELLNLSKTFYSTIQQLTTIENENRNIVPNSSYDIAMKYFMNNKTDAASIALGIVMSTPTVQQIPNTVDQCSCNSFINDYNINASCYSMYKDAMNILSSTMLGSANFYKDWFYIQDANGKLMINEPLIDALITLVEEFELLNVDLSFSSERQVYNNCCSTSEADISNIQNHKIVQNYLQVLYWVKSGCIDNNINKIKIYGEKFGALLSKL